MPDLGKHKNGWKLKHGACVKMNNKTFFSGGGKAQNSSNSKIAVIKIAKLHMDGGPRKIRKAATYKNDLLGPKIDELHPCPFKTGGHREE